MATKVPLREFYAARIQRRLKGAQLAGLRGQDAPLPNLPLSVDAPQPSFLDILRGLLTPNSTGPRGVYNATLGANLQDRTFFVGTSTQEIASAWKRKYFMVANFGTDPVNVSFGQPAVLGTGIEIPPGGLYEPMVPPWNNVTAISAVSGQRVAIVEG